MPILYNYTGSLEDSVLPINVNEEGLGLQFPFESKNKPFLYTYTTLNMVKSNLRVLLQTEKGERLMKPDFGINIRSLLFEPITQELNLIIEERIKAAIDRYLPLIEIDSIDVTTYNDEYKITINIKYHLKENKNLLDSFMYTIM